MSENKIAKIPVASHGLHKHSYNYPWLSSINFGDVMPCYINPIRKGERDNPKAGLFSQLMPIAHNAFATGRYNFKAVFVPYKLVWRPWYAFDQQVPFTSNGLTWRPERYPFVESGVLSRHMFELFGTQSTVDDYDVLLREGDTLKPFILNSHGRRVLRILGACGCMPSWIAGDKNTINILPLMCYIKAFADYYYPNNYVGDSHWHVLTEFFDRDLVDFDSLAQDLLQALDLCSLNYYQNSVFDFAWDNPTSPNVADVSPAVSITDSTIPELSDGQYVTNEDSGNGTVTLSNESNRLFSQYILNVLKSVSMWAKRRQLAGARLLDKFLVSRGVTLGNDSARISYFLGQRNIEIEVSGVENNTDVNLGELAGRGVATSGNQPLSFECNADDDGIFFVIVSPIPDANFPVYLDGFATRQDYLDNYTAEYDKLGSAAVPLRVVQQSMSGYVNEIHDPQQDKVFGFLNMYWDEIQERPRLLGDFILKHRGAEELRAYHTFRIFDWENQNVVVHHSHDFMRMSDSLQYQRLFYSDSQENLMLFLRWYGEQYKEKLPLGDSYEWDDDELNRKVSVVVGGSQK